MEQITAMEFERYVDVQMSGVTNMFAIGTVQRLTGLNKEKVLAIMENYETLEQKFPEVLNP